MQWQNCAFLSTSALFSIPLCSAAVICSAVQLELCCHLLCFGSTVSSAGGSSSSSSSRAQCSTLCHGNAPSSPDSSQPPSPSPPFSDPINAPATASHQLLKKYTSLHQLFQNLHQLLSGLCKQTSSWWQKKWWQMCKGPELVVGCAPGQRLPSRIWPNGGKKVVAKKWWQKNGCKKMVAKHGSNCARVRNWWLAVHLVKYCHREPISWLTDKSFCPTLLQTPNTTKHL